MSMTLDESGTGLGFSLVTNYGWRAFDEIHVIILDYVHEMYLHLDSPLHLHLILKGLQRNLRNHMEFEEKILLPHYRNLVHKPRRSGEPSNFDNDHFAIKKKIRENLDFTLTARFKPCHPSYLRDMVVNFDELLAHHHQRELEHLFPFLQESLSSGEKSEILALLSKTKHCQVSNLREKLDDMLNCCRVKELSDRFDAWNKVLEDNDDFESKEVAFSDLPATEGGLGVKENEGLVNLFEQARRKSLSYLTNPSTDFREMSHEVSMLDRYWKACVRYALSLVLDNWLNEHQPWCGSQST